MQCGRLVSLVWLNGALVSLVELREVLEAQRQRKEKSARMEKERDTTAGSARDSQKSEVNVLSLIGR